MNYKRTILKYKNFEASFNEAFVGIPKSIGKLKESYYGTLKEFKKKYPDFKFKKSLPAVVFMHGSKAFTKGRKYREWIIEDGNFIFFAPSSFAVKNRPTYVTPAPKKDYKKVHKFRQAEISYTLSRINELPFVDRKNLYLMGSSEGGLAAGAYRGSEFKGRVILSWSCEKNYFTTKAKIGAKKSDPILSIIGSEDEFFGVDSKTNVKFNIEGHCKEGLKKFKNSKVVILPQTPHDIGNSPYSKMEILQFLNHCIAESH